MFQSCSCSCKAPLSRVVTVPLRSRALHPGTKQAFTGPSFLNVLSHCLEAGQDQVRSTGSRGQSRYHQGSGEAAPSLAPTTYRGAAFSGDAHGTSQGCCSHICTAVLLVTLSPTMAVQMAHQYLSSCWGFEDGTPGITCPKQISCHQTTPSGSTSLSITWIRQWQKSA